MTRHLEELGFVPDGETVAQLGQSHAPLHLDGGGQLEDFQANGGQADLRVAVASEGQLEDATGGLFYDVL